MSVGGFSITEALKILEELPSDNESECTENSDTEVYVTEQSDYTDVFDDDEEVDDPSYPGPFMQHQVLIWSLRKNLQNSLPHLMSKSRLNDELWELQEKTPVAVFKTLFRVVLMEHIVFENATQSGEAFLPSF